MGNALGRASGPLVIGYREPSEEEAGAVSDGTNSGGHRHSQARQLSGRRQRTAPVQARPPGTETRLRTYGELSEVLRDYELLNAEEALTQFPGRAVRVRPRRKPLKQVTVKDDTVYKLALPRHRMVCLTPAIAALDLLQVLDLSGNRLTLLPDTFGPGLRWLEELDLSGNRLAYLPESFGLLKRLQRLDCSGNRLQSLPGSMLMLQKLRHLSLAHNDFEEVPTCLLVLPKLNHLDLQNNYRLRILPAELAALPRLHFVKVMGCDLFGEGPSLEAYCSLDGTLGPPSLLECCLRVMISKGTAEEFRSLPVHLQMETRQALKVCSFCNGPMLWHWQTRARIVQRTAERLCLRYRMCQAHFDGESSRTAALFNEFPNTPSQLLVGLLRQQYEGQWRCQVQVGRDLSHPTIVIEPDSECVRPSTPAITSPSAT